MGVRVEVLERSDGRVFASTLDGVFYKDPGAASFSRVSRIIAAMTNGL